MPTLAEEFFGSDVITNDPPDFDSRDHDRDAGKDPYPPVRIALAPIAAATDRYPRGFGAEVTGDKEIRSQWVLQVYVRQIRTLLEEFGFVSFANALPNRVIRQGRTPAGNTLMHIDGSVEKGKDEARIDWDFTQLMGPWDRRHEPRMDPTHLADTRLFFPEFAQRWENYFQKPHAECAVEVKALYEEMLRNLGRHRLGRISNSVTSHPKQDQLLPIFLKLQREAFYALPKGRYDFMYGHKGFSSRHLVIAATGLNCSHSTAHGRLSENPQGDLDSSLYPLVPTLRESQRLQELGHLEWMEIPSVEHE